MPGRAGFDGEPRRVAGRLVLEALQDRAPVGGAEAGALDRERENHGNSSGRASVRRESKAHLAEREGGKRADAFRRVGGAERRVQSARQRLAVLVDEDGVLHDAADPGADGGGGGIRDEPHRRPCRQRDEPHGAHHAEGLSSTTVRSRYSSSSARRRASFARSSRTAPPRGVEARSSKSRRAARCGARSAS
jgi:hypothetical protein